MAPAVTYRSTRGGSTGLSFEQAVFEGLAPDGGLFVPDRVPDVSAVFRNWRELSFADLAFEIGSLYCSSDEVPSEDLRAIMHRSYKTFNHPDVVPSVKVDDMYIMELFHGPTFAFKDVALQALGNLYEYFLQRNNKRITVLGATSGDTGSAAIYGLRGKKNVECFILFPEGRVSQIQQQQMTSVLDANVHCVAVKGTFDDCQNIVKELFVDLDFKKTYALGAVNSINWARIMLQITYYFWTYFKLSPECDQLISFSVPTGNFGDVLAGYYAKRMGLPVRHLVVATNSNDIVHRFFSCGEYDDLHDVAQTCSPSMDIGISSNFERYLFYLFDEDPMKLAQAMATFKRTKKLHVGTADLSRARKDFLSGCASEPAVRETIRAYDEKFGYCLDPHTACGVIAANSLRTATRWARLGAPMVVLGTAHPAKFCEVVQEAMGRPPTMPEGLAKVQSAPTRFQVLPNSAEEVRSLIKKTTAKRGVGGADVGDPPSCGATCVGGLRRLVCGGQ